MSCEVLAEFLELSNRRNEVESKLNEIGYMIVSKSHTEEEANKLIKEMKDLKMEISDISNKLKEFNQKYAYLLNR